MNLSSFLAVGCDCERQSVSRQAVDGIKWLTVLIRFSFAGSRQLMVIVNRCQMVNCVDQVLLCRKQAVDGNCQQVSNG